MDYYARIAENVRARVPVGVATVVAGPGQAGDKMLVFLDGTQEGDLGLGELGERVAADAREALRYERAETRSYALPGGPEDEPVRVFFEVHVPPPSLIIVGAGHTSIPLSSLARIAGFDVTLIDARAAFAARERFPDVNEIIVGWPHEVLSKRQITATTYFAVLTHDSKFEDPLLPILLRSPARYIGVIGSRRTQVQRRERLRGEGFTEEDIARLSGPIGLDIGAVTPEEIALSILAEMVARQHGRPGGFLSEKLAASAR
jgi:xanthine dehydrogenase accessory factor